MCSFQLSPQRWHGLSQQQDATRSVPRQLCRKECSAVKSGVIVTVKAHKSAALGSRHVQEAQVGPARRGKQRGGGGEPTSVNRSRLAKGLEDSRQLCSCCVEQLSDRALEKRVDTNAPETRKPELVRNLSQEVWPAHLVGFLAFWGSPASQLSLRAWCGTRSPLSTSQAASLVSSRRAECPLRRSSRESRILQYSAAISAGSLHASLIDERVLA